VEATLRELSSRDRSGKTLANIAEAIASFCSWCVIRNYLDENPLAKIGKINTEPQEMYRALTIDEIRRLLQVAPEHLQVLYIAAMTTGLRAGELRSLTRDHLDVENSGLWLEAAWTKNRKATLQPLPRQLTQKLLTFSVSGIVPVLYEKYYRKFKCPDKALLYVPSHPARTLDIDLETAGIPKHTTEGKVAFHALRTAYVTLVYEAGANHREAQALARHSTPGLTANVYGRTRNERLSEVTQTVGDRVLFGAEGANMVHGPTICTNAVSAKPLKTQALTAKDRDWRRGDSNPRPVMLQNRRLHV